MNAKALFAITVAIALLSSGVVLAFDAAQFEDASSTPTRTEAKADLAQAKAGDSLRGVAEIPGDFQPALTRMRSRDEVRAEADVVGPKHGFNAPYVGA